MASDEAARSYAEAARLVDACPLILPKDGLGIETTANVQRHRKGVDTGKRTAEEVAKGVVRVQAARKRVETLKALKAAAVAVQQAEVGVDLPAAELRALADLLSRLPTSARPAFARALAALQGRAARSLLAAHTGSGWGVLASQWHPFDATQHAGYAFLEEAYVREQAKQCLQRCKDPLVDVHQLHDAIHSHEAVYDGGLADQLAVLSDAEAFPSCLISTACRDAVQLLADLTDAVEARPDTAGPAVAELGLMVDVARLWGATARLHWAKFGADGLSIGQLVHNNSLYFATACQLVAERWGAAPPSSGDVAEAVAALREVAERMVDTAAAAIETLSQQVTQRILPALQTLEKLLLGFIDPVPGTAATLDGAFSSIMSTMKAVQGPWKEFLPLPVFREHLGRWATAVHQVLVTAIPQVPDIQTKDADTLVENLSQLHLFECWFVDEGDLDMYSAEEASDAISRMYLPHRGKLEALLNVLSAPHMADMMEQHARGFLAALPKEELVDLVKALYAPSMKRTQNIRTILADGEEVLQ